MIPKARPQPAAQAATVAGGGGKLPIIGGGVQQVGEVGERIVIYGAGGAGKTSLAGAMPGESIFVDLDESLPSLPALAHIPRLNANTYQEIKDYLSDYPAWARFKNVIIDSGTKLEELEKDYICDTVPDKVSGKVSSFSDYSYGQGMVALHEEFCRLLAILDRHRRDGRNVVLICHEMKIEMTNVLGTDTVCSAPALLHATKTTSRTSTMERVRNWADHVFFVRQEYAVSKDGKSQDKMRRTIYTSEWPGAFVAKSRRIADRALPYTLEEPDLLWQALYNNKEVEQ